MARVILVIIAVVFTGAGCTRSKESSAPKAGQSIPVAALFQYSSWSEPETARTPRFVIYEDGRFIWRRDDNFNRHPELPAYWCGTLSEGEMSELALRQTQVLRDPEYAQYYDLAPATDLPCTVFYFGSGKADIVCKAYGLWSDDPGPSLPNGGIDMVPKTLLAYYVFLNQLIHAARELKAWHPDSYVALLRPTNAVRAARWPAAWPGWKEARVYGNIAEIVVPVTSDHDFWSAAPSINEGVVVLDNRKWLLNSYPHFPSCDKWQAAIESAHFGESEQTYNERPERAPILPLRLQPNVPRPQISLPQAAPIPIQVSQVSQRTL